MFRLGVPWPVKAIRRRPEIRFRSVEGPTVEERRKAQRRRQLVDRRTRGERRMGLERLLDPRGTLGRGYPAGRQRLVRRPGSALRRRPALRFRSALGHRPPPMARQARNLVATASPWRRQRGHSSHLCYRRASGARIAGPFRARRRPCPVRACAGGEGTRRAAMPHRPDPRDDRCQGSGRGRVLAPVAGSGDGPSDR